MTFYSPNYNVIFDRQQCPIFFETSVKWDSKKLLLWLKEFRPELWKSLQGSTFIFGLSLCSSELKKVGKDWPRLMQKLFTCALNFFGQKEHANRSLFSAWFALWTLLQKNLSCYRWLLKLNLGYILVKLLAYFLINNGTSGFRSNTLLIENIGLK